MAERLQPELAGIRRPLGKALRLCFNAQIISPSAHWPRQISTEGNLCTGVVISRGMVDLDTRNVECACGRELIDLRLDTVGVPAPFEIKVCVNHWSFRA